MKIICMGDSLTKGYKIKKKESWVALADSRSEHNWINQGILGDSSTGLLSRLERDCFSHNPQAAILMAGTNDIIQGVSLPIIQSNMACIVHHCHHFNVSPYLGIPILADPELASVCWGNHIDFESVNHQLLDYHSWLVQFGEQFSCPVIDFQTGFSNAIAAAPDKDWYLDGLHPTALGNEILAKSLPNTLYKTSS
jgi:lysophospholipase L1-like esterase